MGVGVDGIMCKPCTYAAAFDLVEPKPISLLQAIGQIFIFTNKNKEKQKEENPISHNTNQSQGLNSAECSFSAVFLEFFLFARTHQSNTQIESAIRNNDEAI